MHIKQVVGGLMALVGSVFALTAQATDYYWKGGASVNWSDASNWYTDAACTKQATKYPNATGDYPRFNTGTTANITLTENITVSSLDLSAENLNLTFSADETAGLKLTLSHGSAYLTIGANTTAAFDGIALARSSGWTLRAGATLAFNDCSSVTMAGLTVQDGGTVTVVDSTLTVPGITLNEGASSFRASGSTLTVNYPNCTLGAGATLELADGTQMTAGASSFKTKCFFTLKGGSTAIFTGQYSGGGEATVTIDDSTLWGKGFFYLGYNGGGDRYVFKGNNPVMKGTGNYFRGNSESKETSSLYFDFEVPVGGFAETPVQGYSGYSSAWMNGTAANHPVYVSILESSPALSSAEYTTTCPLVYSPFGIYLAVMNLQGGHTYTYTKMDGTKAPDKDNGASKYLTVTLGSGSTPAPKPAVEHSTGVSTRAKVNVSRRTLTFVTDVTALATTGTTRARYLVGETKGDLAEVSTTEVTAIGELSIPWTAPSGKLNNTYYTQVILETLDSNGQVVYSESSSIVSATTQDTTVYTWQAVEGEWDGVWSDKNHWAADTGDDRLDYPQTTYCQMVFPADQAVTITVDQSLSVGKLKLNKNGIDVTLVNAAEDKTQNKMVGIISCDGTYDCSITFKYLEFKNNDNTFPGNGKKIRFENGYFWTTGYYQGKGTSELYLKDSTCYIGSYVTISSDGVSPTRSITLDNSQMTVVGNFCASYYKYSKILFKGQNPKLYLSSADKTIYSELDGVDASFEFEIPEGGFTEPPISCVATDTKKAFNDTKKLPAFNFVILETSPALLTAGDSTYPLMTWAPGITTGRVNFDGVVSATDTFLYGNMNAEGYDWQPVTTSTLSNPTAIGVKIHGLTSTDIVTVQGNPGDYGVASPAYGKTTGHTAGETATYSVPEPTFESEGVSYSVTGYVVSNVLADLSYEFASEGKTSSFEYTHPATATVVTWLWGRAFVLAVNAAEGGSVTPTSKTCAEGEVVEVTATPDSGYAFYKWTGDTEGIDDVTQPKISVTMDRARTLTANFGASMEVNTVDAFTKAVESAPDGSTITVAKGEYQLTNGVYLSKAVKIVGATGNPEDVIFYGGYKLAKKAEFQIFTLNHADARLESVTASHGYGCNNYVYGMGIRIAAPTASSFKASTDGGLGGTVVNCIVRDCWSQCKFCSGDVYLRAANALLDRCVITNNIVRRQTDSGGGNGAFLEVIGGGVARNTLIADNSDPNDKSVASIYVGKNSSLVNCTIVNNSIIGNDAVGGVQTQDATAKVINCVIAGNTTKAATPEWASWAGNAASFIRCAFDQYAPNDDCYAGAGLGLKSLAQREYRLINGSACIDIGSEANYGAYDLDGAARVSGSAVDAGCYEFDQNQFAIGFTADIVSGFAPLEVTFTPSVSGVSASDSILLSWDFNNDGTVDATSTVIETVTHIYESGVYSVCLTVENKSTRESLTMTNKDMITAGAKILYVDKNSTNPVVPYDTPETAANNVQDAIDAALAGAEVRIYDGEYQLTKEISLEKEITVTSVSGNKDGVILRGGRLSGQDFRVMAINAGPGALVHSLTVADGFTGWGSDTGGIYLHTKGGVVSNCVVTGCAANYKFDRAGGVYASGANALVTHCILSNNFGRAGYTDGANPSGAAIALFSGARCEHTLITRNQMGQPHSADCYGIGPSQNTVHVGENAYLRFCTVVSNDAYYVAGVNVESAKSHVEYCVIAGNHSRHADEVTWGGATNGGIDHVTSEQVNRWHVWGVVGNFSYADEHSAVVIDDYVCTQERANATASVAAAFKTCSGDTVTINDACKQVQAKDIFVNYERGNLRIPYGTAISDLVAPADLEAAGIAMPSIDVRGKCRLRGEKYDIGAIECQMSDGTLLLVK